MFSFHFPDEQVCVQCKYFRYKSKSVPPYGMSIAGLIPYKYLKFMMCCFASTVMLFYSYLTLIVTICKNFNYTYFIIYNKYYAFIHHVY